MRPPLPARARRGQAMTADGPDAGAVARREDAGGAVQEARGSERPPPTTELFLSVLRCLNFPRDEGEKGKLRRIDAALEAFTGLNAGNAANGLLSAQSVALHTTGLDLLQRSQAPGLPPEAAARLRRDALSLLRCMHEATDLLDRRRGIGVRQVVRVEKVVVREGGQAIVGAVATGGGGGDA